MPGDDHWSRPDLNRGLGLPTFEHSSEPWRMPGSTVGWLLLAAAVLLVGGVVVAVVR